MYIKKIVKKFSLKIDLLEDLEMIQEFYMLINIIKDNYDVRNLFRLKKETNDTAFQDEGNLFRMKKENK